MKKKSITFKISILFIVLIALYYLFTLWQHQHKPLTLYGNVDIRDVNLSFRVSGRLIELKVDEGDDVHKGDLIARLDPDPYQREVQAAQAMVSQQNAALDYAKAVFLREKKLLGTGASSTDHYESALSTYDAAKANLEKANAELSQTNLHLEDTSLYAPSDGVVLTRVLEPGSMVATNATIVTVSLIDPVWVRAYVSERELSKAKTGTHVKIYSDSTPEKFYEGKIGFVSSTAEFTPKTVETTDLRTELVYRLRIIVQDAKHELRQGMPVTVRFIADKDDATKLTK